MLMSTEEKIPTYRKGIEAIDLREVGIFSYVLISIR